MSYLDVPRLHFSGNFIANPSTVNNDPANFDPANFGNLDLLWNPMGNHFWQFKNCVVRSAFNSGGQVNQDPAIQAPLISTDTPVPAKLVDLDTQQQMVSQIWGLQIKVGISDTDYFVGDFRVVCFNDLFARVVNGVGMPAFGAYFQSVLDNVTWGSAISSPFLKELQSVSPARLSIKFVVDGYQPDNTQPDFTQGRVVGTIGPASADEPPNFVTGRALRRNATVNRNPLNFGYARVDKIRQKVLVDLGNSVPTASPGGPPPSNLGTLQVVAVPSSGSPIVLGDYDYSLATYLATAGIQEFSVTADQLATLASAPLGIVQVTGQGSRTLLQEGKKGTYVAAARQFYRMNPGEVEVVELVALRFGEPAAGQKLSLKLNTGTPASALTFPSSVTTGDDGRASVQMTAADPGNPRQFIDGQVYRLVYSWAEDNDTNFPPDRNNYLSILVFDSFVKEPTWENIQPILKQYAALYPFMDTIFQLDNPTVIQQNIAAFKQVLNIPVSDPRHMPVTRDMSRDKRQVILDWLEQGAPTPELVTTKPKPPDTLKAPIHDN